MTYVPGFRQLYVMLAKGLEIVQGKDGWCKAPGSVIIATQRG